MKVTLIDHTGKGHGDELYAAKLLIYTKKTRLEQGISTRAEVSVMSSKEVYAELSEIARTIRSSWEFVDFTFEILGVTRAFTHQLVRTRHGSYAQQAQRVADMRGFGYLLPETVKEDKDFTSEWINHMSKTSELYADMVDAGIPAQDARGVLPTNIHTNIIAKFNLRTFAELVGKRENLRAQGEYADVVRAMLAEVMNYMPWVEPFVHPERTRTPMLDTLMRGLLGDKSPAEHPEINAILKEIDLLKGTWG
jgi:flavin-dependent thymidylate synthase